MQYTVELKPRALKELRRMQKQDAAHVVEALTRLKVDLAGDVKKLTDFTPEYRLRVGQFRVLFEVVEGAKIVVYRIAPRREVYR